MEDKDASDYILLSYDGDLVTRDSTMQIWWIIQDLESKDTPPTSSRPSVRPSFYVVFHLSRDDSEGQL